MVLVETVESAQYHGLRVCPAFCTCPCNLPSSCHTVYHTTLCITNINISSKLNDRGRPLDQSSVRQGNDTGEWSVRYVYNKRRAHGSFATRGVSKNGANASSSSLDDGLYGRDSLPLSVGR